MGSREQIGTGPARVLVVDDHQTLTDLVILALDSEPDLECVGAAHDAATARELVVGVRPDIVLMDVNLGDGDGLELAAELTAERPELRVVVLTAHTDVQVLRRAVAASACAILPKNGSLPDLLSTIRTAQPGGLAVHPTLLRMMISTEFRDPPDQIRPSLTQREHDVLQLLAGGVDVRTISRQLDISVNTCRGYVKSLLSKLDAHSQLEAVVIAGAHGLLDESPR